MKVIRLSPHQVILGPAEEADPVEQKEELVAVQTEGETTEDSVTSGFTHQRLAQVIDLIQESQKRKSQAKNLKVKIGYTRYQKTLEIEQQLNMVGSQLKKIA